MVSPQQPTPGTMPESTRYVSSEDRGIRETVPQGTFALPVRSPAFSYFWGAVIAGTLATITFSVMSFALMFGCHVGTNSGELSFGVGSGIWTVVTAALAYLLGGFVAARISSLTESGWLSGLAVWSLSIPLALILSAIVVAGAGLAAGLNAPQATEIMTHPVNYMHGGVAYGQAWTLFISMIVGLICALIGAMAGVSNPNATVVRS